jgi:hypothetical protein
MKKALKYEDLKELGAGTTVYCVNHTDNTASSLIIRSEIDDMQEEGFMLEPCSGSIEWTGHTIPFMEGVFFRTPEDAIHSVSANLERAIREQLELLGEYQAKLNQGLKKLHSTFQTWLIINGKVEPPVAIG